VLLLLLFVYPCFCLTNQPGKLVAESDAKADVLAQLEAAFRAAPAPGGDSKAAAAKKAAAAAAAGGGGGR
jgi:hypothetical protein